MQLLEVTLELRQLIDHLLLSYLGAKLNNSLVSDFFIKNDGTPLSLSTTVFGEVFGRRTKRFLFDPSIQVLRHH